MLTDDDFAAAEVKLPAASSVLTDADFAPDEVQAPAALIGSSVAAPAPPGTVVTLNAPAMAPASPARQPQGFGELHAIEAAEPPPVPDSTYLRSAAGSTAQNILNPVASLVRNTLTGLGDEEQTLAPEDTGAAGVADATNQYANKGVWEDVGADPRSTNTAAQLGRGTGMVASTVPLMAAGPMGLPAAVVQMTGGAAEQARYQTAEQLKAAGITDPAVISAAQDKAEGEAALHALPGLAAYMIGGKLFGMAAAKLVGEGASVAAKTLAGLTGATVSNVGVGSVMRALEAEPGHRMEAALPKIENLTADTLFAVMHAHGVYSEASAAVRAAAAAELQRRGATPEDLSTPPPANAPSPAQVIVPAAPSAEEAAPAAPVTPEAQEMHAAADKVEQNHAPQTAEALRQKAAATEAAAAPPREAPPTEDVVEEQHRPALELFNGLPDEPATPGSEPPVAQQGEFPIDAASRPPTAAEEPPTTTEPPAEDPAAVPEPASETQISGLTVREVPLDRITLSTDVPQFKHGADSEGVVEPLQGKFDRTGVGPVQLWERLNGSLELISGRHRRKLAIDSGETTIPAQIHREADGFDLDAASTLDAELNIRDGQGSTSDYASYFRLSGLPEADASSRGLLARAKGRAGFRIATGASEDVFALHQQGRLTDAQAEALSTAAPGNDAAQRIGLRAIFGGASIADARNTVEAALAGSRDLPHAEQGDFFANTALDDQWQRQAKVASQHQRDLREQISAVQGAAKKPEVAARLGVDVKDPAGVQNRVAELRAELGRWEKWSGHPDLVAITRGESPKVGAAKPETKTQALNRVAREKREHRVNAVLKEAGESGTVELTETADPTRKRIVSPENTGDGRWRVTSVDEGGHGQHITFPDRETALRAAAGEFGTERLPEKYLSGEFHVTRVMSGAKESLPTLRSGQKQGDLLVNQTEDLKLVGQEQKQKGADPFGKAIQAIIDAQPPENGFTPEKVWLKPIFDEALRKGLVTSRADFDAKMAAAQQGGEVALARADFPPHINLTGEAQRAAQALHDQSAMRRGAEEYHFARRSENPDQGALFSKAEQTPEQKFVAAVEAAAAKAPSQADLTGPARTIEFPRPDRPAVKITVQNTKEALMALAEKYRPSGEEKHQQIQAWVDGIRANGAPKGRVVRNRGEIPEEVRSRLESGTHEGFYDPVTDEVYLLSDNITSLKRAQRVYAHELVGHRGVKALLPYDRPEWKQIGDTIFRVGDARELNKIAIDYVHKTKDFTPEERAHIVQEYVARLAENPAADPKGWQAFVQWFRNVARKLRFVGEWTEADIRDLLRHSRDVQDVKFDESGTIYASVRDLGKAVGDLSPYAQHIEDKFERIVPDAEARERISRYVESRLGSGPDEPHMSAHERNIGERFITYFRNKAEWAKRNGVAGAVQDAYEARLRETPGLSLVERMAVYDSEANRLVAERTTMRGPGAAGAGEKSVSATKNALVDERRQKYGLPPAMEPARHAFGAAWDEAMRMIDSGGEDSNPGRDLVDALEKKPRAISDVDNALLLHRQITIQNEYEAAARAGMEARDRGDDATAETARIQTAALSDELLRIYTVGKKVGTEAGRALNVRKMLAREDYSLARMEMRQRSANGGRPLDGGESDGPERQELNRRFQQIEMFTKAAEEVDSKMKEAEATNQAKDMLKEVVQKQRAQPRPKKAPPAGPEAKPATEATKSWLQRQAEAAKERIRQRGPRAMSGIDPLDAADRVIVAADWIASGLRDFAGYAARVVREWGQEYTPHLKDIWDRANALIDNHEKVAAFAAKARQRVEEGATLRQLRPYIQKAAEGIVRQGTVDLEPLLDQLHPFVEEIIPGTTRRQTMDAFSGYGEFRPLDKDAVKAQLRDLRGQAQQTGKILDMQSGQPPKKTGPERRTPSDKERPLIKEVNRLKKEGNFTVTDPETQLRSAKQSIKTRLRNAIVDMAIYMDTGERPADSKKAVEYDQEMDALKQLRDQMKATLEAIEPKPGMTEEQIDKATIRALEKSMDEYDRRFDENDYLPKQKKGGRYGPFPVIDMMRSHRNAMREEFMELRELDDAWQQQKAEKRQQDLLNQIAEIDSKLEAGKYDAEQRGKKEATPENQALRDHRDELQKQFAREQRAASTPLLTSEQKQAKQDERVLRSYKTRLAQREYDLQARTAFEDFAPRTRRTLALDDEAIALKAREQRAKNDFEKGLVLYRLQNRTTWEKFLDGAAKWRRAFVLSGSHPIFKLTSAAGWLNVFAPAYEVAGAGFAKLPYLRDIAERAPREGYLNTDAEVKAIVQTTRKLGKDFWHYMRHGGTELDQALGPAHLYPFEWKELLGRLHGALKTPVRRNEYTRSLEKRLVAAARRGEDPSDPLILAREQNLAYQDANNAIFMESNVAVDMYKRALSALRTPDKATGQVPLGRKAAETGLRILFPVVRIPTNIVASTLEHTFGVALGSARAGLAIRRGIENLPPEHADLIMHNLKRGSLGLALMAIGFFNYKNVGGYYNGKRDEKDVETGGLRLFGVNIPKLLVHNPLLEQLQIGATIARVAHSKLHNRPQSLSDGAIAAFLGIIKQTPFIDTPARIGEAIHNQETLDKFGDKFTESIVVPAAVRELAQATDKSGGHTVKRAPRDMKETIKASVLGLRQTVPKARK